MERAAQIMDEAVAREGEKIISDLKEKRKKIEEPAENMSMDAGASSPGLKRPAEFKPDDPNTVEEGDECTPIMVGDVTADYSPTSPAKSENGMGDSPTMSYNSDEPEAVDDAMDSLGEDLHSCDTCQGGFVSKNKLFKHLRRMQHFGLDKGSDREWRPSTDEGSQGRSQQDQDGETPDGGPEPKPISALGRDGKASGELTWKYIGTGV